ncbi:MAG: preprotein translocase subunit SecE [Hyphomonadaceae bacterium]
MAEKTQKTGPITFVRQVRQEGSKVTWTSQSETITATIMVLVMSIIISIFLFSGDFIISALVRLITGLGS